MHITATAKLRCRLNAETYQNTLKIMEEEKYQITDKDGNEVLANVSGSLFDFIQECDRMISLYKNQRYTQAEQLRDKLAERLDDVMRGY